MKIPEKAPDFNKLAKEVQKSADFLDIIFSPLARKIYQKANKDYVYWDKFKYFSIDDRLNHEKLWVGLNLQRKNQLKQVPILDTQGRNFGYWLPSSFLEKLHFIDQYCGGQILVDEISVHVGEKERYLINSIMEEAIASSLLEGAATTRRVAKEMLRSDRKPKDKAEKMVKNNYLTINYMKNIINEFIQKHQTPQLTKEFLKELQEMMTMDTLEDPDTAGRFRKANEPIEVREEDGIVLHTPPSANDIEKLLDDLCDFANSKDDEFIHPVVKAIILHFWLAYIHPFVDGNGRTARALFYWYMMREGYWMMEFLSISRTILKAPRQYLRSFLYSEIDNQDLTYFIGYNLKAIMLAIEELKIYLSRKQKEFQKGTKVLRGCEQLNVRQQTLIYHALSHPGFVYSIASHRNVHGIVYQTARTDFLDLVKLGLFEKIKKGRSFYFRAYDDLTEKLRKLSS